MRQGLRRAREPARGREREREGREERRVCGVACEKAQLSVVK